MDANQTLQYYTALKLHFSSPSYDFFKYQGQVKYALNLDKRKDKWQIAKITKHPDPFGLLIANLSVDPNAWTGDIISDAGIKRYKAWQKRNEALTYTFEQDIKKLHPNLVSNWAVPQNEHPYLLKLYLGGHICLETMVILNHFFSFYGIWAHGKSPLKNDIAWNAIGHIIPKYTPFVKFNKELCQNSLRKVFSKDK